MSNITLKSIQNYFHDNDLYVRLTFFQKEGKGLIMVQIFNDIKKRPKIKALFYKLLITRIAKMLKFLFPNFIVVEKYNGRKFSSLIKKTMVIIGSKSFEVE